MAAARITVLVPTVGGVGPQLLASSLRHLVTEKGTVNPCLLLTRHPVWDSDDLRTSGHEVVGLGCGSSR